MSRTIIPKSVMRAVANGPIHGFVPTSVERNGRRYVTLVPQAQSARFNTGRWDRVNEDVVQGTNALEPPVTMPAEQLEQVRGSLPPTIRSTAQEKYQALLRTLYRDGLTQFTKDGKVRWPKSIETELAILGAAQGNPSLVQQVEALAARFIVKGARQQQEQDARQTARGWHGHLSA